MFLNQWMNTIKDEVLLKDVVMPGSHNAGSYGMARIGCCQDGTLFEQYAHGVRHFVLRLATKKGNIVMSHGPILGVTFEDALIDLKQAIDYSEGQFFILDLREYYPQKLGPIKKEYAADPKEVDRLIEKYLAPERYAMTEFDIKTLTMGDIRKSGKKYIIMNYRAEYAYSVDLPFDFPWEKKLHGTNPKDFIEQAPKNIETTEAEGMFGFQIQLTPNFFTELGMMPPRRLDRILKPYFGKFMQNVESNPDYVKKLNIMCGDFMTTGTYKAAAILRFNLLKNNVKEECIEDYAESINAYFGFPKSHS